MSGFWDSVWGDLARWATDTSEEEAEERARQAAAGQYVPPISLSHEHTHAPQPAQEPQAWGAFNPAPPALPTPTTCVMCNNWRRVVLAIKTAHTPEQRAAAVQAAEAMLELSKGR